MVMKKKKIVIPIALILILLLWVISWLPVTERINIDLKAGEDIRIALITDLHSCYYGPGQKWLRSSGVNVLDRVKLNLKG